MTYSWAIILIAIVISVYFILTSSTSNNTFSPSYCYISAGFPCYQLIISTNTLGSTAIIAFTNNIGKPIYFNENPSFFAKLSATSSIASGSCTPSTIQQGGKITCSAFLAGFFPNTGSQLEPQFFFNYSECVSVNCKSNAVLDKLSTSGSSVSYAYPANILISESIIDLPPGGTPQIITPPGGTIPSTTSTSSTTSQTTTPSTTSLTTQSTTLSTTSTTTSLTSISQSTLPTTSTSNYWVGAGALADPSYDSGTGTTFTNYAPLGGGFNAQYSKAVASCVNIGPASPAEKNPFIDFFASPATVIPQSVSAQSTCSVAGGTNFIFEGWGFSSSQSNPPAGPSTSNTVTSFTLPGSYGGLDTLAVAFYTRQDPTVTYQNTAPYGWYWCGPYSGSANAVSTPYGANYNGGEVSQGILSAENNQYGFGTFSSNDLATTQTSGYTSSGASFSSYQYTPDPYTFWCINGNEAVPFTGWSGSGTGSYSGSNSNFILNDLKNNVVETAEWGNVYVWVNEIQSYNSCNYVNDASGTFAPNPPLPYTQTQQYGWFQIGTSLTGSVPDQCEVYAYYGGLGLGDAVMYNNYYTTSTPYDCSPSSTATVVASQVTLTITADGYSQYPITNPAQDSGPPGYAPGSCGSSQPPSPNTMPIYSLYQFTPPP